MTVVGVKSARVLTGVTLLALSAWSIKTMDIEKIIAQQQPFIESGTIEWDSGSIPILEHVYPVDILNQMWRGTTATFSPSTLGFDKIGSWQMFSFLVDLGPLQAIWLLESSRPTNVRRPAYL